MSNDPTEPPVPPQPPDPTAPIPSRPPSEPPPSRGGSRRTWIVVAGIVVVVAVIGTLAAIALSGDDDTQAGPGPTGEPSVTLLPSPTETTGPSPEPTGSRGTTGTTGSANPGCSGATAPATLAEGTYFGFVESVGVDSGTMGFDLACFYTGEEANEQAAQRGDEVPVPNDVYIVNDNTTIRDVPVDPSTGLLLIDWNECCETSPGAELAAFASAIGGPDFVEIGGRRYAGSLSPYWVTIENGQVVLIEEQFLP